MVDYLKKTREDLFHLKSQIISNSISAERRDDKQLLPRYSITQSFFNSRSKKLDDNIRNFTRDDSMALNYQNFQEYRFTKLIYFLEEAKQKFYGHQKKNQNLSGNGTSQLCIVHDIIKNSKELISLLYLMRWLEAIFLKDSPKRDIEKKFFFSSSLRNENSKDFNPDCFNNPLLLSKFSCIPHEENIAEYLRILERIVIKVRSGNLVEAQTYSEYNNLFNVSAILFGGLPVNDFLFDDLAKISNIDFDLFPNYMRNKEFEALRKKAEIVRGSGANAPNNSIINNGNPFTNLNINKSNFNEDESAKDNNNIVGNPNWLSWLHANYQLANNEGADANPESNRTNLSRMLQSFVSGNPKYFEDLNNYNPYNLLYTKILSVFNAKLLKKYLATQRVDLHFTDDPDFSDFIASQGEMSIEKIIADLQNMERFKNEILENDFLLDIELEIIKAHFAPGSHDKLVLLEYITKKLSFYMSDDYLSNYLENQFFAMVVERSKFSRIPEEQKGIIFGNYVDNCIVNYWKIAFLSQLGISLLFDYEIGPGFFKSNVNINDSLFDYRKRIVLGSEEIIGGFFNRIIEIFVDETVPEITVYLLAFWNDIMTIITALIHLVSKISTKNQFDKVIKEIDVHFEPYTELINRSLANQSKIYPLIQLTQNIDDVLNIYLSEQYQILKEDELKIEKASLLFSQNNVEKTTHLKHILKLALKFLVNRKFAECEKTLDRFTDKLETSFIIPNLELIAQDYQKHEKFNKFDHSWLVTNLYENYSEAIKIKYNSGFGIPLCFCKDLIRIINDCFFSYFKLSQLVLKSNITDKHKLNIINENLDHYVSLIRLIKFYNFNVFLKNDITEIFGEDLVIEILNIIGEWIYQISKWTLSLHYDSRFRDFISNKNSCLRHLLDYINTDSKFLTEQYLSKDQLNIYDLENLIVKYVTNANRTEIIKFAYDASKRNTEFISDVFDQDLLQSLKEGIQAFDGISWKDY